MEFPFSVGNVARIISDETSQVLVLEVQVCNAAGQLHTLWLKTNSSQSWDLYQFLKEDLAAATIKFSAWTVEELADQMKRDLNGPKDAHDLAMEKFGVDHMPQR